MSKLNKVLFATIAILLVILGIVIYWQKVGFEKSYWAVYLDTGDVYFGKLNRFPKSSLTDVYFLQRNPDDQQNPLSLTKFNQAFWGPEDKIYLNKKNIIWKAKLKGDSQIVQFIKNPQANQNEQQAQPPAQPQPSQPQPSNQ